MTCDHNVTANDIIQRFQLIPHPEGGYFRETFRDDAYQNGRAASTAIYFLLKANERSHWHRIDATEVWHWYAGSPLQLSLYDTNIKQKEQFNLGNDFNNNEYPQCVVPAQTWQSAQSLGAWTFVGCTVSPGFEFAHFELAEKDWEPASI
ncbi:MAG: cupin domain-containing protein [Pseudomonadota bacterium]